MPLYQKLAWLGAAGAGGALARYGVSLWMSRLAGTNLPWSTLAVNAAGCFLFGFVWTLAEGRFGMNAEARAIVLAGFLGSFTTFSTFAFETLHLMSDGRWLHAAVNFAGQNALGLALCLLGMAMAKT